MSNNNNKALKLERKKERNKTVSNRVNEESYTTLKQNLTRERLDIGDWLQDAIDEYNKIHGDGNPSYTLDHYVEDDFLATPAYHRPLSAWKSYLTKCSDLHYKQWVSQLESLLHLEKKVTRER